MLSPALPLIFEAKQSTMSHSAVFATFFLAIVMAVEEHVHLRCTSQLECVSQFRRAFGLKVAVTPQHSAFNEEPLQVHSCTYLIFEELQERGIITRPMSESLNEYLRISIGTEEQNEHVLKTLAQVMKERNANS